MEKKDKKSFVLEGPKVFEIKRKVYIVLFACLGVMVAYFLYVLSTVATIFLLLFDYRQYGFGLPWKAWTIIGYIWLSVALLSGAVIGTVLGKYWWRYIYVDKKLTKKDSA